MYVESKKVELWFFRPVWNEIKPRLEQGIAIDDPPPSPAHGADGPRWHLVIRLPFGGKDHEENIVW